MSGTTQFVTLGAGNEVYAAPVEKVQEILEMRPIARLPRTPPGLLGMIDVRSESVPVVDLCATLGMAPVENDENTRIVVLRLSLEGKETVLGLRTDRVFEVTVLDSDRLDPPPATGRRWDCEIVAGIGRRNGSFVTVLDLERLLADSGVDHDPPTSLN